MQSAAPPEGVAFRRFVASSFGRVEYAAPFDPLSGAALCMQCYGETGDSARAEAGAAASVDELFCSGACRGAYFCRRSGASLRRQLHAIDRGVCRACGLDCDALVAHVRQFPAALRARAAARFAPALRDAPALLAALASKPSAGRAWHADHIHAVRDGGGGCGLGNLQTLCVVCHRRKSADEAKAIVASKRAEAAPRTPDDHRRAKRGRSPETSGASTRSRHFATVEADEHPAGPEHSRYFSPPASSQPT